MKKYLAASAIIFTVAVFSNCGPSKKATAENTATKAKTTYDNHVQAVVVGKCAPCHFPDKGGNKLALNTYDAVKNNIDDIIRRIELNPGDRGYMPFKKPKLHADTIAIFKQWKEEGMAQ